MWIEGKIGVDWRLSHICKKAETQLIEGRDMVNRWYRRCIKEAEIGCIDARVA